MPIFFIVESRASITGPVPCPKMDVIAARIAASFVSKFGDKESENSMKPIQHDMGSRYWFICMHLRFLTIHTS
jgi:hypothetical protein